MYYITTHHFDRGKLRLPHGYSLDYEIWTLNMLYKYKLNTTTITCTRWVRALGISRPVSTKSFLKRDDSKTKMSFFSQGYIQMLRIRNMSKPYNMVNVNSTVENVKVIIKLWIRLAWFIKVESMHRMRPLPKGLFYPPNI